MYVRSSVITIVLHQHCIHILCRHIVGPPLFESYIRTCMHTYVRTYVRTHVVNVVENIRIVELGCVEVRMCIRISRYSFPSSHVNFAMPY